MSAKKKVRGFTIKKSYDDIDLIQSRAFEINSRNLSFFEILNSIEDNSDNRSLIVAT